MTLRLSKSWTKMELREGNQIRLDKFYRVEGYSLSHDDELIAISDIDRRGI